MPAARRSTIFRRMTNTAVTNAADVHAAGVHAADANVTDVTTITVTVNGEPRPVARGTTVGDLLRAHALDPRMVVVEHNRTIRRDRAAFDTLTLAPGDTLEIVHFVGGG